MNPMLKTLCCGFTKSQLMIDKPVDEVSVTVFGQEMSNFSVYIWFLATLLVSGFLSMLRWLNTPMPVRTWGQAILAYVNGVAVALLTALLVGDKVLAHEVTVFQFTFLVLIASIGGAQVFDFLTKTFLRCTLRMASAAVDKTKYHEV